MFDLRTNSLIAGAAFAISLLVGSLSGGSFLIILMRALIFAGIFFVIAGGINLAVSRFLPELLDMRDNDQAGSHVDITVEDEDTPAAFPNDESDEEVGNIGELVGQGSSENIMWGTGLDQTGENGYNSSNVGVGDDTSFGDNKSNANPQMPASPLTDKQAGAYSHSRPPADERDAQPAIPSRSWEDLDSVDILPDLEDMAKAFLPLERADEEESDSEDASQKRPSTSGKGRSPAGDFNPKDMAQALQTILKRDE
jgi:hypothetical protein